MSNAKTADLLLLTDPKQSHTKRRVKEEEFKKKNFKPFPKTVPRGLTAEEKKAWKEIVDSVPKGYFNAADAIIVEQAARLIALLREVDPRVPENRGMVNMAHGKLPTYFRMLNIAGSQVRLPPSGKKPSKKDDDGFSDL